MGAAGGECLHAAQVTGRVVEVLHPHRRGAVFVGPVAELAIPVVTPGQDGTVALQCQGVTLTAGEGLDLCPMEVANLNRRSAVVAVGAVAQLTEVVVAPGAKRGADFGSAGRGGSGGGSTLVRRALLDSSGVLGGGVFGLARRHRLDADGQDCYRHREHHHPLFLHRERTNAEGTGGLDLGHPSNEGGHYLPGAGPPGGLPWVHSPTQVNSYE